LLPPRAGIIATFISVSAVSIYRFSYFWR